MPNIDFDEHLARVRKDPEFARLMDEEGRRLDAAVSLMRAREEAGLTQEGLSEKSGVSRSTVNRIERGRISPSFHTLGLLASAMGKHLTIGFTS